MILAKTEAIRLISLALADKMVGAKVSINTWHSASVDAIIFMLNRVYEGNGRVSNANLDENGNWHFDAT